MGGSSLWRRPRGRLWRRPYGRRVWWRWAWRRRLRRRWRPWWRRRGTSLRASVMLEPGLIQNAAAVGTAFAASLVECVGALTIVLAGGSVSGVVSRLLGAAAGAAFRDGPVAF